MHHDCPPVLMLLYIMLVYLVMLTASIKVVCLYNACLLIFFISLFHCYLHKCSFSCISLFKKLLISFITSHHVTLIDILVSIFMDLMEGTAKVRGIWKEEFY